MKKAGRKTGLERPLPTFRNPVLTVYQGLIFMPAEEGRDCAPAAAKVNTTGCPGSGRQGARVSFPMAAAGPLGGRNGVLPRDQVVPRRQPAVANPTVDIGEHGIYVDHDIEQPSRKKYQ